MGLDGGESSRVSHTASHVPTQARDQALYQAGIEKRQVRHWHALLLDMAERRKKKRNPIKRMEAVQEKRRSIKMPKPSIAASGTGDPRIYFEQT